MLSITNNSIKHQSLVYTLLNDQTVLFQAIQFSISDLFALNLNVSSISPTDRTLLGATTLARVNLGAMAMKEYIAFPKAPALLELHHEIVYCHIQDIRWGEGLTPQQRCRQLVYSTASAI